MNWFLGRKLEKLADRSNPDRAFVRTLESRLRLEAGHMSLWAGSWKWAVSGATILTLAGSATGVYAYSSDEVLPDHPLYALRQEIEQVEETLAVTPERRAEVQVKRLTRRLRENDILAKRNKPLPKEDAIQFANTIQKVINETSTLPEAKQEKLDQAIETLQERREKVLMIQRDVATTTEEKTRAEGALQNEKERIRKTIDAMEEARKRHFTRIRTLRIERLQQRIRTSEEIPTRR